MMNNVSQNKIKEYITIVEKVAKVEHRRIPSHMVDYEELVSIGIIAVQAMIKNKTPEQLEKYNSSYIGTAVRWAIRNELRNRYRWYGVRRQDMSEEEALQLKNAVYKTILSTDELFDSEKTYEVKDSRKNPEESCEYSMITSSIKSAVMTLPKRERELIESKFFQEKKLCELSNEFSISPSRISRIIKTGLDKIKEELVKNEVI